MTQADLFAHAPLVPGHPHEAAFFDFIRANPSIPALLAHRARRAKQSGQRIGMRCLWETLRYDWTVKVVRLADGYRLNDHHAPLMARYLERECPDLAGYFETRNRKEAVQ